MPHIIVEGRRAERTGEQEHVEKTYALPLCLEKKKFC